MEGAEAGFGAVFQAVFAGGGDEAADEVVGEEVALRIEGDVLWFCGRFFGVKGMEKGVRRTELTDAGNLAEEPVRYP